MSGGRFDYMQYQFDNIANEILEIIRRNELGEEKETICPKTWDNETYYSYGYDQDGEITERPEGWQRYSDETIREFQEAYIQCKKAGIYAQRVDWLVSGDDDDESFHQRLRKDLEKLHEEIMELGAVNWCIGTKRED